MIWRLLPPTSVTFSSITFGWLGQASKNRGRTNVMLHSTRSKDLNLTINILFIEVTTKLSSSIWSILTSLSSLVISTLIILFLGCHSIFFLLEDSSVFTIYGRLGMNLLFILDLMLAPCTQRLRIYSTFSHKIFLTFLALYSFLQHFSGDVCPNSTLVRSWANFEISTAVIFTVAVRN